MINLRRNFRDRIDSLLFKTRVDHIAMVSMVIAMGAVFFGFLYMNTVVANDMDVKDLQVNSLIDEVGELKQERTDLYQEILKDRTELVDLEAKIEVLGNGNIDIDALADEMIAMKSEIDSQKSVVETVVAESQEILANSGLAVSADETFDVLILGTNGALTDTIMIASVNIALETVSLISIPRDLYVDGRKINEHYNLYGVDQMKQAVYDITGILPEKYVVVDLQAFVDIVDAIGGIDVYVEKELYDNQYPGANNEYTVFYMPAGDQHMNGETALKYARSRKTSSDFDRAKRQQDVIGAVRDKVGSMNLYSDTSTAITIFQSILDNLDTDIDLFEGLKYYTDYKDYTLETGNVLSTSNYLYSTYNLYGQYILLPNGGDYSYIKSYIADVVKN